MAVEAFPRLLGVTWEEGESRRKRGRVEASPPTEGAVHRREFLARQCRSERHGGMPIKTHPARNKGACTREKKKSHVGFDVRPESSHQRVRERGRQRDRDYGG